MPHFNIPIFIPHLGCPFQCIFCNQSKITAVEKVLAPVEVKKIIDAALKTLPPGAGAEVAFFGGSFTAIDIRLQQKYLSVVKPYIVEKLVSGIRISTRPDFIDHSKLEFLRAWGVKTIELGVQSLDDKVLLASGRGYKSETVLKAAELIKEQNFQLGIQLMVGLPQDNLLSDLYTTRRTIALGPDMVRIYPTLVIEGTPLAARYRKHKYKPLSLAEAVGICMQMYLHFQKAGIKVIRMGLHPEEELTRDDTLLAGPFHPSFGELVMQEIFKEQAGKLMGKLPGEGGNIHQIRLYVNSKDLSKMIGCRKQNISFLKEVFGLRDIFIAPDSEIPRDAVGISRVEITSPQCLMDRREFIAEYFN